MEIKPQMFSSGQLVACIDSAMWIVSSGVLKSPQNPVEGVVYTVVGYDEVDEEGDQFLFLAEIPTGDSFNQESFAPLVSDEELEKELNSIPELVHI